jgi:hypothetical protein
MTLDVRSLWDWCRDLLGRGRLSGGGPLGEPSVDLDDAALDDEGTPNLVAGEGMVAPDEQAAWHKSHR